MSRGVHQWIEVFRPLINKIFTSSQPWPPQLNCHCVHSIFLVPPRELIFPIFFYNGHKLPSFHWNKLKRDIRLLGQSYDHFLQSPSMISAYTAEPLLMAICRQLAACCLCTIFSCFLFSPVVTFGDLLYCYTPFYMLYVFFLTLHIKFAYSTYRIGLRYGTLNIALQDLTRCGKFGTFLRSSG